MDKSSFQKNYYKKNNNKLQSLKNNSNLNKILVLMKVIQKNLILSKIPNHLKKLQKKKMKNFQKLKYFLKKINNFIKNYY